MYTDEQRAIIQHQDGHARITAVAGSGKSMTMIGRIGYLLAQGVDPRRILVLMFNRDARDSFEASMRNKLLARHPRLPQIRTYHAFALRLVRSAVDAGLLPEWPLETAGWRKEAMANKALREITERGQAPDGDMQADFLAYIDLRKASMIDDPPGIAHYPRDFGRAYAAYENLRQQARVRFFEDLLKDTALLFERSTTARQRFANHVDHILVDEFQDTAPVQAALLKVVAGSRALVTVVGDNDQCIYEWRGADPSIMGEQFERDYPSVTRYTLSRTFRFGHRVSLLANHVIRHNGKRDDQLCVSAESNPETQIAVVSEMRKHHPILDTVNHWLKRGGRHQEIMVICRLWAMSLPIELALLTEGIPYRIEDDKRSVFHRREVISLLGHLRLSSGHLFRNGDTAAILGAMLDFPTLYLTAAEKDALIDSLLSDHMSVGKAFNTAAGRASQEWQKMKLRNTGASWSSLQTIPDGTSAGDALRIILGELDLWTAIDNAKQTPDRKSEARLVTRGLQQYALDSGKSITDFLGHCEALSKGDTRKHGSSDDRVRITSAHRCKGLEAPLVYIPGAEQELFPSIRQDKPLDLEAERRLFYVAITRAQQQLVIGQPWPTERLRSWMDDPDPPLGEGTPSQFLREMQWEFSEQLGGAVHQGRIPNGMQADDVSTARQYLDEFGIDHTLTKRPEKVPPVIDPYTYRRSRHVPPTDPGYGEHKTRSPKSQAVEERYQASATSLTAGSQVFGTNAYGKIRKGMRVRAAQRDNRTFEVRRVWRSAVSRAETVRLVADDGEERDYEREEIELVLAGNRG